VLPDLCPGRDEVLNRNRRDLGANGLGDGLGSVVV